MTAIAATVVDPPGKPAVDPPVAATEPVLLAGKYSDELQLAKGIREIQGALGMPPLSEKVAIIGDAGLYPDVKAAETAYVGFEKLLRKPTESPKPVATDTRPVSDKIAPVEPSAGPAADADPEVLFRAAGLDPVQVTDQWIKEGRLTENQYLSLAKAAHVDLKQPDALAHFKTLANMQMRVTQQLAVVNAEQELARAVQVAGGETQHKTLRDWAATSMPPEDLKELNATVRSGKLSYSNYVRLIAAEHAKGLGAGGVRPLVNGAPSQAAGSVTTLKEFKDLVKRAGTGDESAIERLRMTDTSKLS
jgi:hypothetical protein